MTGVYEIRNVANGNKYIGSSVNINKRFKEHIRDLRSNRHHSIRLQRAWNKYREGSFVFEILKEVSIPELKKEEQILLDECINKNMFYNMTFDSTAPSRGRKFSKKERNRMSETAKKLMSNPEYKKRVMEASKIARDNPEVRKKISDAHKGIMRSEEAKNKTSATLKKMFSESDFKKKFTDVLSSESVRKNMSVGAKKRWGNLENQAKQSERVKAYFSNPENRAKNSVVTKNFFANPENRRSAALRQPTRLSVTDINFIREKGKEHGMQTKLCEQFNLSKAHISNIVNNKSLIYTASL